MSAIAQRYLFAADVHLEVGGGPRTELFTRFLDELCRPGDVVYLLGDVFDLWLGRGHERAPDYADALEAMRSAARRGVHLKIVPGNRDVLVGREVALACGAEVLAEQAQVSAEGQQWLVCHGDQFCTADRGTQRLRRCLSSWPVRLLARLLPMRVKRWIAAAILRRCRVNTARKSGREVNLVEASILQRIDQGIDVIVCGHVHRQEDRPVGSGRLFVLNAWGQAGTALIYADEQWQWASVD